MASTAQHTLPLSRAYTRQAGPACLPESLSGIFLLALGREGLENSSFLSSWLSLAPWKLERINRDG